MNIWEEYKEDFQNSLRVRLLLVNKEIHRFHDYLRAKSEKEISTEGAIVRTRQIVRLTEDFNRHTANNAQTAFVWQDKEGWNWHGGEGPTMGAAKEEGAILIEVIAKLQKMGFTQFRIELLED